MEPLRYDTAQELANLLDKLAKMPERRAKITAMTGAHGEVFYRSYCAQKISSAAREFGIDESLLVTRFTEAALDRADSDEQELRGRIEDLSPGLIAQLS